MVTLSKEGYSGRAIAKKLQISVCAVQGILKKARETGAVKDRKRSGRPPLTTARQNRLLFHLSVSTRRATSRMLKRDFEDATGVHISSKTVRRLVKAGLTGCVAAKRPMLTAVHRKRRLDWCCERKDWTADQWKKILILQSHRTQNMILRCYPNVSALLWRHTKSCLFQQSPLIREYNTICHKTYH